MKKLALLLGAVALCAFASSFAWSPADANVLVLPGPHYGGLVFWNNDGTVESGGVAYTEVRQQDKIFSDFSSGSSLPAGTPVQFSFATANGVDHHTVGFLADFSSGAGFTWGYDINVVPAAKLSLTSGFSDLLQTAGAADLETTLLTGGGKTYTINFTKTGSSGYTGTTSAFFSPTTDMLAVTDRVTGATGGSNASGVSNSFVETAIPEPSTWALMGVGLALIGGVGLRSRRRPVAPLD